MDILMAWLIALALLAGGVGIMFASEATFGVAAVAVGCLLAILARIAQAASHRSDEVRRRNQPV